MRAGTYQQWHLHAVVLQAVYVLLVLLINCASYLRSNALVSQVCLCSEVFPLCCCGAGACYFAVYCRGTHAHTHLVQKN